MAQKGRIVAVFAPIKSNVYGSFLDEALEKGREKATALVCRRNSADSARAAQGSALVAEFIV
jgi:hypothetical protein